MFRTFFAAALCLAGSALAQAVPTKVNFSGRIVDSGAPVTGSRDFVFKLFPTIMGGSEVWTEPRMGVAIVDGAANVDLGAITPLTAAIFDGQTLYLEVSVGGTVLTPRTPVLSVPYALRSTVAAQVGTLTAAQIQQRVSGACGAGAAIQTINTDGTVSCQAVGANDAGVTSITNITAGAGLIGGGSTGNVALAVNFAGSGSATTAGRSDHTHTGTYLPLGPVLACAVNDRVVSINPSTGSVVCAPGGITSLAAGSPLSSSGGATPTISLGLCLPNEIYKMLSGAWRCAPDDDSGGTLVNVNVSGPLTTTGGNSPTLGIGVLPTGNGGAGVSLASTGGPRQFVKQQGVGSAFTVGTITAAELPSHSHIASELPATLQNWATQPTCPAGQYVSGIGSSGTATCVPVPAFGAVYTGTCPAAVGPSCSITVPSSFATGSTAGTVVVGHPSTGNYTVTFPWIPTGVPQVTIYGGPITVFCRVFNWSSNPVSVNVFCGTAAGVATDAVFNVTVNGN